MGREYGQIRHDLYIDDDFLNLTMPAQWFFLTLIGDSKLSYAGVAPYHLGRMAQRAGETTGRDVLLAAAELSERHFIVVDEETEEVMIRSHIRKDPFMKNPRLAVTMTKDYGNVASKRIRGVIVHELTRLRREQPDLGAWEKPQVKTILRQTPIDPRDLDTDLPMGAAAYLGVALPSDMGKRMGAIYQASTTGTATKTSTGTSPKEDAASSGSSYPQGSAQRSMPGVNDSRSAVMSA